MTLIMLALGCLSLRAGQLTDSVRVHFRVNQTAIDTLLMGNDAAMRGFADRMQALSSNDSVIVTVNSILITGAASPEGSIPYNKRLSRARAAAITHWLQGYFEFPDTLPQFVFKGRDWQGLLMAVIGDPDVPNKKEVIDLIMDIKDTDAGAKRDGVARLKALRGGKPYRYLLRRHFPGLRASEIFIEAEITKSDKSDLSALSDESDISDMPVIFQPDSIEVLETSDMSDLSDMSDKSDRRGYVFALKTNLLCDAVAIPSIGAEFPIGKHFSLGVDWMYAWWKNHERNRHWRIYGGDVCGRYYFCGKDRRPLTGHHVGVYAQALLFQIAFGGKGYITGIPGQDIWGKPLLGGGVEYGYSRRIGTRLNIDLTLGIGYAGGEYEVYRPIDNCYVWQSTHRTRWFGPTKAQVSLEWLIGRIPHHKERKEVAE